MKSQTPSGLTILSEAEFISLAEKKESPDDIAIFRACSAETKLYENTRQVRFAISSDSVDRERDVINLGGWELANYQKNPVVLWAHNYREPPVARALATGIEGRALVSTADFVPKEVYPFAETIFQMVKMQMLNASSVGFRPLKYMFNEERRGIDIEQQELLEWSIVPVPCNADALAQLSALPGEVLAPYVKACEALLEVSLAAGLWVPGKVFSEAALKALKPVVVAVKTDVSAETDPLKILPDCPAGSSCGMPEATGDPATCPRHECPLQDHEHPPLAEARPEGGENLAFTPAQKELIAVEVRGAVETALKTVQDESLLEFEDVSDDDGTVIEIEAAAAEETEFEVDPEVLRQGVADCIAGLAKDAILAEIHYAQGRVD